MQSTPSSAPIKFGVMRLRQRRDFLRVQKRGRKWAMPGLVLQTRQRSEEEHSDKSEFCGIPALRLGFTVSKRVGNAVTRNRAKRRLRAAAEQLLPRHGRDDFDIVVIGRKTTPDRPFVSLVNDLKVALEKLDAYKPE
jgi:ribonuclease P protein component